MNKVQATKAGKNLLKKMKGKGWKLHVWENMGWQYCVINGPFEVFRADEKRKYNCIITLKVKNKKDAFHCSCTFTSYFSSSNPNKVVIHESNYVQEGMAKFTKVAERIMK